MFALTSKAALAPTKVRVADAGRAKISRTRKTMLPREGSTRTGVVLARASSDDQCEGISRRDILAAPGMVAFAGLAAEQLWLPGSALAAAGPGTIRPIVPPVTGYDDSIKAAKIGPIGGAFPCSDYKAFEKVIYGFIEGVKTGDCPPAFKNSTRGFLLKQDGIAPGANPKIMLTLLTPEADHKEGLAFFINEGPKANPLWASDDIAAFRAPGAFTATASTAQFFRGEPLKNVKGKWFGQYNLGWNGKFEDWIPEFTSPEADDFHNGVGVEFSVAHTMDLKSPGNTYKPKAKIGIEVFHCFNSLQGAKELEKAFNPDSPFFVNEKRYAGPYDQTIWKVMDDIDFTV